jgi:hypothetical protein
MLTNISQFSILEEPNINQWLDNYVFAKTPLLMEVLVNQGMFVTSLLVFGLALFLILLASKVKAMQRFLVSIKSKLMWSSVLRSQIQTYFATSMTVFSALSAYRQ